MSRELRSLTLELHNALCETGRGPVAGHGNVVLITRQTCQPKIGCVSGRMFHAGHRLDHGMGHGSVPRIPAVCSRVRPGLFGSRLDFTVASMLRPGRLGSGLDLTVLSSAEYPEALNITSPLLPERKSTYAKLSPVETAWRHVRANCRFENTSVRRRIHAKARRLASRQRNVGILSGIQRPDERVPGGYAGYRAAATSQTSDATITAPRVVIASAPA